ncbi:MAG: hypothetical protein LAP38_16205 [Acidobacteriia bacterium]|nr:hypothetical protein [Terriglobia bacterium]
MLYRRVLLAAALLACSTHGQTLVDLRTQSKSIDFSSANTTKPFKSGTALPATCSIGEAFFKTNAPAGSNLYACTALNAWTLQSGGAALAGDVTGSTGATVVTQIQGRPVSSTAPAGGQSMVWNSGTGSWAPQTIAGTQGQTGPQGPTGPQGITGAIGASGATGAAGPQGPIGPTGPSGVSTLSGDVTGAAGATVVTRIQGRSVSATAPANGQSMAWSSGTSSWTPQTIAGAPGPTGPTGPQGPTGSQGAAGATGSAGATGATGPQGPTGPTGPQGATGTTGSAGATGAAGPQGPTGSQGATGSAGATGATGAQGATGAAGSQGPTGPTGPAGTNGAVARIQNTGTNLPVEATLNFTGGGCSDDAANGRTNCTGSGGISGLAIATNGTTQGTQSTLNFISGTGIVQTCTNNAGSSRVDCTPSLNTSVALTINTAQSGAPIYCNSSNGTTAYTCSFASTKTLTAYSTGMFVLLRTDASNSGGCSLNIDALGVKSIKQKDGSTDPTSGQIAAGQFYWLFYDGTVWRMQ